LLFYSRLGQGTLDWALGIAGQVMLGKEGGDMVLSSGDKM